MKTIFCIFLAVSLASLAGCKKNQTVMAPIDERAVITTGGPVEVIDVGIGPVTDDGYAHDAAVDLSVSSRDRYEVRRGDTLWSIAMNVYGDGKRWPDIAQANRISNPQRLRIGQLLVIP